MPPGFSTRRISRKPGLVVGQVAETESHGDQVERGVAQRQAQGVGFEQRRGGAAASAARAQPAWGGRNRSRSPARRAAAWPSASAGRRCRSRYRARARPAAASMGRTRRTVRRAPEAVDVEGEQVVGQVVAAGHAAEHAAHPGGGFLLVVRALGGGAAHDRAERMASQHQPFFDSGDHLHLADAHRQHEMDLALHGLLVVHQARAADSRRRCRSSGGMGP